MATLAADTFDRADSGTVGGGWNEVVGAWSIVSNKVQMITHSAIPNVLRFDVALGASPAADYDVEAIVRIIGAGQEGELWVFGRYVDVNNFYIALANTGNGNFQVWKRVSGSYTQLGSYSASITEDTDYTVKLSMAGTTIKGYLDGVERISVTDSGITGTGRAALGGFPNNQANGGLAFNDFTVYGTAAPLANKQYNLSNAVKSVSSY